MARTSIVNGVRVVSTHELGARLGITVSGALMKKIGVRPFANIRPAIYWREDDISLIRSNLAILLLGGTPPDC